MTSATSRAGERAPAPDGASLQARKAECSPPAPSPDFRILTRRVAQPGDVDATAADLTKARAPLGYEPQVDLAEGLRWQWEWPATSEHRSHPTTIEAVATLFG